MQALILAAGKGTRLHPITNYLPKPMLPLHGKPLLEWAMLPLVAAGVTDFVLAVSYFAEQIKNYFGDGGRWGVTIHYSEGPAPAGKAGEVWRGRQFLLGKGPFLVIPGDTICHLDYQKFWDFHRRHGGPVSVAFSTQFHLEVGLAEIDSRQRITRFLEKANLDQPVSTGAYILEQSIFPHIEKYIGQKQVIDLPGDIFPHLLAQNISIYGFVGDYYWWDVGRISDYEDLAELPPAEATRILQGDFHYKYV